MTALFWASVGMILLGAGMMALPYALRGDEVPDWAETYAWPLGYTILWSGVLFLAVFLIVYGFGTLGVKVSVG
jgi:hypothetical protein